MSCDYDSALEAFKASIYYVNFQDFPDDLIEAAIGEAECLPRAAFLLKRCPKVYQRWLVNIARILLVDLIEGVVTEDDDGNALADPVINVSSTCDAPNTFLKRREVLGIKCEWAEVKSCLDCDKSSRAKWKRNANDWYDLCVKSQRAMGWGLVPMCETECVPCEAGKVR